MDATVPIEETRRNFRQVICGIPVRNRRPAIRKCPARSRWAPFLASGDAERAITDLPRDVAADSSRQVLVALAMTRDRLTSGLYQACEYPAFRHDEGVRSQPPRVCDRQRQATPASDRGRPWFRLAGIGPGVQKIGPRPRARDRTEGEGIPPSRFVGTYPGRCLRPFRPSSLLCASKPPSRLSNLVAYRRGQTLTLTNA